MDMDSDNEPSSAEDMDQDPSSEEEDSEMTEPAQPGSKRKKSGQGTTAKKKKKTNVKPPTAEEIQILRETENLYQSNLFRLQIDEMLNEIKPHKASRKGIKKWINDLIEFLTGLPEQGTDYSVDDLKWLKKLNVKIPLQANGRPSKATFKFVPPVEIVPVGSYSAGCMVGPNFVVDLAVVMPKRMFVRDDCLNQRYHIKRALYLAYIASHLKSSSLIEPDSKIEYWTQSGDPLKPVVVLIPAGKALSTHVQVILHPVPQEGTWKFSRFQPTQSNLRPDWWGISGPVDPLIPSPNYNASVIEDLVTIYNEKRRKETLEPFNNIKQAIMLIKVWLRQRNLDDGYGAFSSYIASYFLIYLLENHKINAHMSSYQVVRHFWLNLSTSDWCQDPANICSYAFDKAPDSGDFLKFFDTAFIDATGFCNLACRLTKATYMKVKEESKLAIQILDNREVNSFQILFMTKVPLLRQYDSYICFPVPSVIEETAKENCSGTALMDYGSFSLPLFLKLVYNVLTKGLGERVLEIFPGLLTLRRWNVNESCESCQLAEVLVIGIRLHPEHSLAVIDKGPEANVPEAAEFKEFWDEKCELRRFRDGTVRESVVWAPPESSIQDRRVIVQSIIEYLFKNKLSMKPNQYHYLCAQLRDILTNKFDPSKTNEEACQKANSVLQELTRDLTNLKDLPLAITSVRCISPVYRFTEIFPPIPEGPNFPKDLLKLTDIGMCLNENPNVNVQQGTKVPYYVAPIDLAVQLSLTGKWPDDIAAGKRLLAAFLIAIGDAMKKNHNLSYQITTDYLVLQRDGYSFRLFLGYGKEISLLKKQINTQGITIYRDTPESIALEKKFINLPKLNGALYGLSQHHVAYGSAAALAKRWILAMMLDDSHFPSIVVDLLVASLFLRPEPYYVTMQPQTAFLRFLALMATTNWHHEPLILNFNNLLALPEITEIEKKFNSDRANLPPLFLATPYDPSGCLWTKESPTLPILLRVAQLASTSLAILDAQFLVDPQHNLLKIFDPPLSAYDVIIELDPAFVARKFEQVSWKLSTFDRAKRPLKDPIVDFDPVQLYLKELRENYGEFALFFYDPCGGCKIGVLFKPSEKELKDFKVSTVNGRKPIKNDSQSLLKLDTCAIINDFHVLGKGVIKEVIVK